MYVAAPLLAAATLFFAAGEFTLPPPYATRSANNPPRVIPPPSGARLRVPEGFRMEIWSDDGYQRPRFMMLGPNNEILLADSARRPDGTVYVFPHGESKERKKLIGGLYQPFGMVYQGGYLYVAESDSVKRYRYNAREATAGPGEEIISLKGIDQHHWTRSLLLDRAGKKIYVRSARPPTCLRERIRAAPPSTATTWMAAATRFLPPDCATRSVCAGIPARDTLWAAVQERDDLGDDLVPDYFTHVQQGGFYGWPYAYIGPHEDPRNKGLRPDLVAKTIVPDVLLGAHVAVLDFVFYTGKQFPAEYQGGAFLAFHGSWNRSKRVGQSIAFHSVQKRQARRVLQRGPDRLDAGPRQARGVGAAGGVAATARRQPADLRRRQQQDLAFQL